MSTSMGENCSESELAKFHVNGAVIMAGFWTAILSTLNEAKARQLVLILTNDSLIPL